MNLRVIIELISNHSLRIHFEQACSNNRLAFNFIMKYRSNNENKNNQLYSIFLFLQTSFIIKLDKPNNLF